MIRQNLGEDVEAYIDRFWNCLIQLQAIEHVSKRKLKRKFISGLLPNFEADVDMFHPCSLADAISLALNSEKKHGFRFRQGTNQGKKPSFSNTSHRSQPFKPPFKKPFFKTDQNRSISFEHKKDNNNHNHSHNNNRPNNFKKPTTSTSTPNEEQLKRIRCFNCHRNGHYADKCPFKKPKDHNKPAAQANMLEDEDCQLNMVQDMEDERQSDANLGEDYDPNYDGNSNQSNEDWRE